MEPVCVVEEGKKGYGGYIELKHDPCYTGHPSKSTKEGRLGLSYPYAGNNRELQSNPTALEWLELSYAGDMIT